MSSHFIKGPLQMLGSTIFMALMAYCAKLASAQIPGEEIALIRFIVGIATALILAGFGAVNLKTGNKRLLILRGTFGGLSILLYFLAMAKGSMTNSTILNNTFPIFATLIAAFTLHESLSWITGISLLVAWTGVGFLVHPDFHRIFWPDWIALLSGVLGGMAVVIVRELRQLNESSWSVFFYLSIFGCLFSLLVAIPVWVWPDLRNWLFVLAAGFFGLLGQLMATSAYRYCSMAVGGVLSMATIVFTAFAGITILGERPSSGEAVGAFLITAGSVLIVWLTGKPRVE